MTKRTRIVDEDVSIKATVLDYTNSNPLAVRLTDTTGDYVGAGAGTQYTEDAAAAANPTGTAPILVRADTPGAVTSADGDNIAQRATNYGAGFVQVVNSSGAFVDTFGGGTEYTEGATDATITGSAILWEDTADTLRPVSAAKPLPVNIISGAGSGGTAMTDDAAFTPATSSVTPAGAFFDDVTPDSVDEGDIGALRMSANRNLYATLRDAAGNERGVNVTAGNALTVDGSATTQPVSGTVGLAAGTNNIGDVDVLTVPAPLSTTGGGTEAAALRVTIASDSTGLVSIDDNGGSLTVDGSVSLAAALPAGTNNIGDVDVLTVPADPFGVNADAASATGSISAKLRFIAATGIPVTGTVSVSNAGTFAVQAAQSGTWTVQPGNTANTTPWLVTDTVATSGGLTMHKTTSAASTNATSVKGSAGQVYSVQAFNVNAAVRYLKLYNKASAPTVGTDTPVKTLAIPGNTAGAGFVINWDKGLAFGTGIAFALTTEATDAGTTGVAANEITVNIDYK